MTIGLGRVLTRSLPETQQNFVAGVIAGYDPEESAVKAGYSSASARQLSYELLQQPQILAAVQIGIARQLAIGAPLSLKLLQRCITDERVDMRLRVACAKDLLNRAGHIAPKAAEQGRAGETPLNEMTMGELRTLADKLEGEIAGRAKEVSSAKPAPKATQAIDDII